jgi:hypothetical protein
MAAGILTVHVCFVDCRVTVVTPFQSHARPLCCQGRVVQQRQPPVATSGRCRSVAGCWIRHSECQIEVGTHALAVHNNPARGGCKQLLLSVCECLCH